MAFTNAAAGTDVLLLLPQIVAALDWPYCATVSAAACATAVERPPTASPKPSSACSLTIF